MSFPTFISVVIALMVCGALAVGRVDVATFCLVLLIWTEFKFVAGFLR